MTNVFWDNFKKTQPVELSHSSFVWNIHTRMKLFYSNKKFCHNRTFLEEGLTGGADPLINPLIHSIHHTVTSLFFYNERPTFLPLFLILAQYGSGIFIILLTRWTTGCGGCGWRMWLSALLLCFHPVWPPPWLVSEQPASPVPAWWLCSWFWLLWGCRPKTSACWSLLIGCCKFKQDVRLLCWNFIPFLLLLCICVTLLELRGRYALAEG